MQVEEPVHLSLDTPGEVLNMTTAGCGSDEQCLQPLMLLLLVRNCKSLHGLCRLKKFAGDCFHVAVKTTLEPFKALSQRCGTAQCTQRHVLQTEVGLALRLYAFVEI